MTKVAAFMGIELDDALLELVVRQSSRPFMLEHAHRFDEAPFRRHAERLGVFPFDVEAAKVTAGVSSSPRYRLGEDLECELAAIWQERVQVVTGLDSYQAFRGAVGRLGPAGRSPS